MNADPHASSMEHAFPPEALFDRLKEILPPERLTAFIEAAQAPREISIRVNTLRASPEEVCGDVR